MASWRLGLSPAHVAITIVVLPYSIFISMYIVPANKIELLVVVIACRDCDDSRVDDDDNDLLDNVPKSCQ